MPICIHGIRKVGRIVIVHRWTRDPGRRATPFNDCFSRKSLRMHSRCAERTRWIKSAPAALARIGSNGSAAANSQDLGSLPIGEAGPWGTRSPAPTKDIGHLRKGIIRLTVAKRRNQHCRRIMPLHHSKRTSAGAGARPPNDVNFSTALIGVEAALSDMAPRSER